MNLKIWSSVVALLLAIDLSVAEKLQIAPEYTQKQEDASVYRLPGKVIPSHYDLWIYTDLSSNNFTYTGEVTITLSVTNPTNTIILHADKLILNPAETVLMQRTTEPTQPLPVYAQNYDSERQFYIVSLLQNLELGEYTLKLTFKGEIGNDAFGFYRSSYEANGKTKWIAITQFSPTFARRAFPCMDEPYMKATYDIHVGHHVSQTATSNMPVKSIVRLSDRRNYYVTTFKTTPALPTYIVAWAVHDFTWESANANENFKLWSRDTTKPYRSTALNEAVPVYFALQKWLSAENPIMKMDQFAVPEFNFNAMENWGMITYRESVVLHANDSTPTSYKIRGLSTMAHEYAHTWFGNLVTPRFWDVVWLKEGLASYFQYFGLSLTKPEWNMMNKFVVDTLQPTLLEDSIDHTRTLNRQQVGRPSDIMDTLDFVSYRKGASIIRMISHFIGNKFQSGITEYLRTRSYKDAIPSYLYESLQKAAGSGIPLHLQIKDVVESWANQPGYPVVTATRNYTGLIVIISQERFRLNHDSNDMYSSKKDRWWIPLSLAIESVPQFFEITKPLTWLRAQDESTMVPGIPPTEWLIINVQQTGYYRVNYDETNWKMLTDYLRAGNVSGIHTLNRAALIDDSFNLARGGYVDYAIPFNLSKYLTLETEYEPWVAATNNFGFLNHALNGVPETQKALQDHVNALLKPTYEQLSFFEEPNSEFVTKLLHRELILSTACSFNNADCLRISRGLFDTWISQPDKTISPDLRSFVYCVGIRFGTKDDWYTVWDRYFHSDLQTERELLLNGLGCTKNPELIFEYLNSLLSAESIVRKQERTRIVNSVLNGNSENVNHVLEFVKENLQKIIERRGYNFLSQILAGIGNKITTSEQLIKLYSFVNGNVESLLPISKTVKEATGVATTNVAWIDKYSSRIAAILS